MALKRANGEGNLRKRSDGTWETRVTLGTDPKTGKLISKSVYARTQKECREKMKALLGIDGGQAATPPAAPKEPPKPRPEDVITVGQWLDTWLKEYLADVKPNTALQYESVVRLHLKPAFGDVLLKDLRTPMIQKFYNKMRDDGVSPKYIKNIHGILHRALDMAMRVEYLTKNPSTYTIRPKVVEKPMVPLDAPEQKKLFEELKGNPFETLFLTATFTGMRIGELIGLTWDCVDFENEVIHMEKQLVQTRKKGQKYRFGTLKNGKTRVIAPAPYIMQVLKKHKIAQAEQRLLMGDLWNPGGVSQSGFYPQRRQSLLAAYHLEGIPGHSGGCRPGAPSGARSAPYLRGEQPSGRGRHQDPAGKHGTLFRGVHAGSLRSRDGHHAPRIDKQDAGLH